MATARRTTKLDDDFTVSAIGFGAGGAGIVYGDVDDAESLAMNVRLSGYVTWLGGDDHDRPAGR